jgi:hypothetical protein
MVSDFGTLFTKETRDDLSGHESATDNALYICQQTELLARRDGKQFPRTDIQPIVKLSVV